MIGEPTSTSFAAIFEAINDECHGKDHSIFCLLQRLPSWLGRWGGGFFSIVSNFNSCLSIQNHEQTAWQYSIGTHRSGQGDSMRSQGPMWKVIWYCKDMQAKGQRFTGTNSPSTAGHSPYLNVPLWSLTSTKGWSQITGMLGLGINPARIIPHSSKNPECPKQTGCRSLKGMHYLGYWANSGYI
jgi:hypothetical protein